MPIGVQLIAKHFDEQTLFDGAKIVENITKWKDRLWELNIKL
jgi:aspartyl-tRNA(Asn)/glutamyl-tRNA(Gln) amidotransferase subunit A